MGVTRSRHADKVDLSGGCGAMFMTLLLPADGQDAGGRGAESQHPQGEAGGDTVSDEECRPVQVSRWIAAPADMIFRVLSDPGRHPDIDGSGTLRDASAGAVISGAGDVFVMRMYDPRIGDFEMNNHVVEYEQDRRIGWEPENGRGHPGAGIPGAGRWRRAGGCARGTRQRHRHDRDHDSNPGAAGCPLREVAATPAPSRSAARRP
jgi:hypothetical protein